MRLKDELKDYIKPQNLKKFRQKEVENRDSQLKQQLSRQQSHKQLKHDPIFLKESQPTMTDLQSENPISVLNKRAANVRSHE